jgi:hypothetical protein
MEHLKGLKQDEVKKKQIILKHKIKEKEWVEFHCETFGQTN